jgi:flavin-binding protein dodecin
VEPARHGDICEESTDLAGGQITFEAEVGPNALPICHCTDCQGLSRSTVKDGKVAHYQVNLKVGFTLEDDEDGP